MHPPKGVAILFLCDRFYRSSSIALGEAHVLRWMGGQMKLDTREILGSKKRIAETMEIRTEAKSIRPWEFART